MCRIVESKKASFEDFDIRIPDKFYGQDHAYAVCPQCSHERKPQNQNKLCLSVSVSKGAWQCQNGGCNWSGYLPDIKIDTYEFEKDKHIKEDANRYKLRMYLEKERFISMITADRYQLKATERNKNGEVTDFIALPFMEIEQVGGQRKWVVKRNKYRSLSTEHKIFDADGGSYLFPFGAHLMDKQHDYVIITEGEMDAMSFHEAGFSQSISVANGSSSNLKEFDLMMDFLRKKRRVYIAVDDDEPGKKLLRNLTKKIGWLNVYIVSYPEGCKDASDVLRSKGTYDGGVKALRKCLFKAKQLLPEDLKCIVSFEDIKREIDDLREHGYEGTVSTGFPSLDELVKITPGQLGIISGYTNHGKSNFTTHLAINLSKLHGWKFLVYSAEDSIKSYYERSLKIYKGKPLLKTESGFMNDAEYQDGMEHINTHFLQINPDDSFCIEDILAKAKSCIDNFGINALVIDNWSNLIREAQTTEALYNEAALEKIRNFAKRNKIVIFMLVHPKNIDMGGSTKLREMCMGDISGGASFSRKADFVITVYRDYDTPNVAKISLLKVKHSYMGTVGSINMYRNPKNDRFEEVDPFARSA